MVLTVGVCSDNSVDAKATLLKIDVEGLVNSAESIDTAKKNCPHSGTASSSSTTKRIVRSSSLEKPPAASSGSNEGSTAAEVATVDGDSNYTCNTCRYVDQEGGVRLILTDNGACKLPRISSARMQARLFGAAQFFTMCTAIGTGMTPSQLMKMLSFGYCDKVVSRVTHLSDELLADAK